MRRRLSRSSYRSSSNPLPAILFLILLILFGGYIFFLWQNGRFGKSERFNLVLATKPVTLVSLDTKNNLATVVSFPDDLYVPEVVPNYGAYKMGAIYRVGELDKRGGQVLSWTIAELLGVPVDGFFADNRQIGGDTKSYFFSPGFFLKGQSNLNLLDRVRFAWGFSQIRFDKIDRIDMGKYAEPLVLADGSTALGVDKLQLDSILLGEFLESGIRDEGLRVEVVNSTPVAALGARAARVLTNIGMTIINVGSTTDQLKNCTVSAAKKLLATLSVTRIAEIYSCKMMERTDENRADVTVVLGTDYAQRFEQ